MAEKLHALTRDYGDYPNTRVRDLVDLVILIESDIVEVNGVLPVVRHVFESRALQAVPDEIPEPPAAWARDYADLATRANLGARTLRDALTLLSRFWAASKVSIAKG